MLQADWSEAERWVWDEIRAGRIADFHQRGKLDPRSPEGWSEERLLRPTFLREIFYDKLLKEEIPPEGVRIVGAWFRDRLALANGRLHQQLWLEYSRFDQGVDFSGQTIEGWLSLESSFVAAPAEGPAVRLDGATINGQVSLSYSTIAGDMKMNSLKVAWDLSMVGTNEQAAKFVDIDLTAAHVEGHLIVNGATVSGKITMDGLNIGRSLFLRGSKEAPATFAEIDLSNSHVEGAVELNGAVVSGKLTMNGLNVGQGLFMQGSKEAPATFADVDLKAAHIEGPLVLDGATVSGELAMGGLQVDQRLFMQGNNKAPATFADVDLSSAHVEGQLSLSGATVLGKLTMNALVVGQGLFMRGSKEAPATFADVDLTNAYVEGQVVFNGATIVSGLATITPPRKPDGSAVNEPGKLKMTALRVGQDLFMGESHDGQPCEVRSEVDLSYATISGGLYLTGVDLAGKLTLDHTKIGARLDADRVCRSSSGKGLRASLRHLRVGESAEFKSSDVSYLDLSGARIDSELRLAGVEWRPGARVGLRNARASVLHEGGLQPDQLELDGFTYDRLGGVGETDTENHERREFRKRYILGWLARDPTYTPQPYEQLAAVCRRAGEPQWASDILYESRERARKKAAASRAGWRYLGLTLLMLTIGYGLGNRYFRSLAWVCFFVALGTAVLFMNGPNATITPSDYPVYSLVRLLPFAKLDEFKTVTLSPFAKYYFDIHQLVGYVLAGFLAAGLAGLTQKPGSPA